MTRIRYPRLTHARSLALALLAGLLAAAFGAALAIAWAARRLRTA